MTVGSVINSYYTMHVIQHAATYINIVTNDPPYPSSCRATSEGTTTAGLTEDSTKPSEKQRAQEGAGDISRRNRQAAESASALHGRVARHSVVRLFWRRVSTSYITSSQSVYNAAHHTIVVVINKSTKGN